MNITALRSRYANALSGLTYDNASAATVRAKVEAMLEADGVTTATAEPKHWTDAIEAIALICRRCAGTGKFITYTENGVPKGPGGCCFRCNGSGLQDFTDGHRNATHDEHYMARALSY